MAVPFFVQPPGEKRLSIVPEDRAVPPCVRKKARFGASAAAGPAAIPQTAHRR